MEYLPVDIGTQQNVEQAMVQESQETNTPINAAGTEGINFELPDIFGGIKDALGNAGKWILIGGGVLAGVWLLGKFIGRKK